MSGAIDFVITWVDGSDNKWREEKRKYTQADIHDDKEERYRDWDLLKFWFRSVEKYAPWVRKIHFITWGHLPKWLNVDNPKLHIVNHKDYIPEAFLPTFNSNVLEIYMHRIQGLSEHFVYFNDDMCLIKDTKPEDFFKQGKPCDMLAFQPVVANPKNPVMSHLYLNNTLVLSKYFNKRECVRKHKSDYFHIGYPPLYFFYNILEMAFPLYTGFYTVHGPAPFCKRTFSEIWEKEGDILRAMSSNRFRSESDLTPYLFREWQKLSGNFKAKNIQRDFRYFEIADNNKELVKTIGERKRKIICVNDTWTGDDFERVKCELHQAFERILPETSSFERA